LNEVAEVGDGPGVPAIARPSASVVLLRQGERSIEVCLLQRSKGSSAVEGVFVFPGGKLDDEDGSIESVSQCVGLHVADANRVLGVASGGISYWVAAVRECFEESGVLLCSRTEELQKGELYSARTEAESERLLGLRDDLCARRTTFASVCSSLGARMEVGRLRYLSHWITPVVLPKRFDTRFFVTEVPSDVDVVHDSGEMVASMWCEPAEALEMSERGKISLMFPTIMHLQLFAGFDDVASALGAVEANTNVPAVLPKLIQGGENPGFELAEYPFGDLGRGSVDTKAVGLS
jgi:8-oxo-dGTP pyrophosphatase MutT (NUDIX family)